MCAQRQAKSSPEELLSTMTVAWAESRQEWPLKTRKLQALGPSLLILGGL